MLPFYSFTLCGIVSFATTCQNAPHNLRQGSAGASFSQLLVMPALVEGRSSASMIRSKSLTRSRYITPLTLVGGIPSDRFDWISCAGRR